MDTRRLIGLLICAVIALAGLTAWGIARISQDENTTTTALCTLRGDLQQRVGSGKDFLKKHPHGIPGIPAATIRTSITGQQRTINALTGLACR